MVSNFSCQYIEKKVKIDNFDEDALNKPNKNKNITKR